MPILTATIECHVCHTTWEDPEIDLFGHMAMNNSREEIPRAVLQYLCPQCQKVRDEEY